jgi:SOS-response transcriptional repressor LexA/transcriptional regulator with XRE-family HTH domain
MNKFDHKALIQRVITLRVQFSGPRGRSKFAGILGISPSTYSYYENDRIPPIEILLKMCEVTGADIHWLLTGSNPDLKFASGPHGLLLEQVDRLLRTNPQLASPISAFVELLNEKQGFERRFDGARASSKPAHPGWIPVLGRTAAGIVHCWDQQLLPESKQAVTELHTLVRKHLGKDIVGTRDGQLSIDLQARALLDGVGNLQANLVQVAGETDEQIVEFIDCDAIAELFPDSFALFIDGDSMAPRISDGDVVIVSPSVPAAQGHIAIARVANQIGVTCKLIRIGDAEVHLVPINERYDTKVVAKKDLEWALAVLCHIRI